jgi:hypothetical protein
MAVTGPKWRCPTCGRAFARTGQRHVCGNWTVEGHLEGKPQHVVTLFEQFSRLVEQGGPFEYAPVRHQVGFQVARIVAGVSLTPNRLEGYLDLARAG